MILSLLLLFAPLNAQEKYEVTVGWEGQFDWGGGWDSETRLSKEIPGGISSRDFDWPVWEFYTLALPEVRETLRIKDEQWATLKTGLERWRASQDSVYAKYTAPKSKLKKLSYVQARQLKIAYVATGHRILVEAARKEIRKALTSKQNDRLSEITLQWRRTRSGLWHLLRNDEISTSLKITTEQHKQLVEAAPVIALQGATPSGMTPKKSDLACLECLTDSQRATWKKMIGKPFEFKAGGSRK